MHGKIDPHRRRTSKGDKIIPIDLVLGVQDVHGIHSIEVKRGVWEYKICMVNYPHRGQERVRERKKSTRGKDQSGSSLKLMRYMYPPRAHWASLL